MAGGMRIDDHAFMGMKGSPEFPKGVHVKTMSSEEGAGELHHYEDTDSTIKAQQAESVRQTKRHPTKSGYRN